MRKIISYKIYSILLVLSCFLSGCVDRYEELEQTEEDVPVLLRLQVNADSKGEIIRPTRAIRDENSITDINIFVLNPNGSMISKHYFDNLTSGNLTISTTSGRRDLYIVANYGSSMNSINSKTDLINAMVSITNPVQMTAIPMAKNITVTIPAPSSPGGTTTIDPISVDRITSKVTVTFDKTNLNSGVTLTPLKITLCQVPNTCSLFASNTPTQSSSIILRGDSILSASEIVSTLHNTATPFYMIENLQGSNGINTDQKLKTPASDRNGLCSFLSVTARYSSPDFNGTVIFRYYLGKNVLNNFDMARNTWYQISISFNGKGGIDENTWRVVTVGSGGDLFNPDALYLPWHSGRTEYFILNSQYVATNIPSNSGDNVVNYNTDSVKMVLAKASNLTAADINCGYFTNTASNPKINVYQRYKGEADFMIDVSALHFPKNELFGSKNYRITQYINLPFIGSEVGQWKAIPTANWVYIGDGNNIQAFTSSGAIGSTDITGMVTRNNGPLNSTSITGNSIAVRCTQNTTNVRRVASVIFYNNANVELARVFISQNPSSYPTSAVSMVYVPGGVYKPGAYKSDGSIEANTTQRPTGSSSTQIYAQISPFYLATTECTNQQFCDFLNDIGALSVTDLLGINAILNKTGILNTDYRGGNVPIGYNVFITNLALISYNGNKWAPLKSLVLISLLNPSLQQITTSNYPMYQLSFYGACDYNYWMIKYFGRTLNRSSGILLPTELEWEAAARGVNNGYATSSDFNAGTSATKNGVFPYAFPDQTNNLGFYGNEIGQVNFLRNIAWYNYSDLWISSPGGLFIIGISVIQRKHPSGNLYPNTLGLYDMSGNVGEWTFDNYNGNIDLPTSMNGSNPCYLAPTQFDRVVKGGACYYPAGENSVANRKLYYGTSYSYEVGLRPIIRVTELN